MLLRGSHRSGEPDAKVKSLKKPETTVCAQTGIQMYSYRHRPRPACARTRDTCQSLKSRDKSKGILSQAQGAY